MDSARLSSDDIDRAKLVDLVDLVGGYTVLRRESAREYSGPCPKCGGDDRLHVHADGWWFCRTCHTKRADAIEWVRFADGLPFVDAVRKLTGAGVLVPVVAPVHRSPVRQVQPVTAEWRQTVSLRLRAAQAALFSEAGEPGRVYLSGRGLAPATWTAYGVGFMADAPCPGSQRTASAIVLPWMARGAVVGLRYRFIEPQTYTDKDGNLREGVRLSSMWRSDFTGRLFGGQALNYEDAHRRAVVIVEGEINAMSVRQVAGDSGLDVLSIGSESARLSWAAIDALNRYRRVIVWADRPGVAVRLSDALGGAYSVASPNGQDANDLLRTGQLGAFLAAMRADAAAGDPAELEALLWWLYDAAAGYGVDAATGAIMESLAGNLRRHVATKRLENGLVSVV